MVNAPNKNLSPLLAGKYGQSTNHSTGWSYEGNEGKSRLDEENVRALEALHSLRCEKKLVAGTRWEWHFSSNNEKEKQIKDYVEGETAVARMRVEDAETAIKLEQEDVRNAEKAGLTTTKPETTFGKMWNVIRDSMRDHASSDIGEDGEDKDLDEADTELGKHSEDDEPSWVIGTISKLLHHQMERFRQKQMKFDELTQQGRVDAVDYVRERDMKYGMNELKDPADVQP